MSDELYDVVIYEIDTRRVDSIAGRGLKRDSGFYNAEKRLDTVVPRLNDNYNADIVPAGRYAVGDILPPNE